MEYPYPKKMNCPITKEKKAKKPKYHNKKVLIDGIWFDSQKEGNRYKELKLLEKAGEIKDLRLQVKFELQPRIRIFSSKTGKPKILRSIDYVADFVYTKQVLINGTLPIDRQVVEDVKGIKTKEYMIKRKLFAYKYGFEISEI